MRNRNSKIRVQVYQVTKAIQRISISLESRSHTNLDLTRISISLESRSHSNIDLTQISFLLWPDWTHGKELPKTKKAKEGSFTQQPKYQGANRITTTVSGDPVFRSLWQRPVSGHDCIGNIADDTLNGAAVRFFLMFFDHWSLQFRPDCQQGAWEQ